MKLMPLKFLLGLILCNLVWSAHPIMGKWLLESAVPIQGAWLRYSSALLTYLVLVPFLMAWRGRNGQVRQEKWNSFFLVPSGTQDRFLIVLLGFLTFCFSPLTQMKGLSTSLATENAMIVAMEPLMVAFLAWLLLRETLSTLNLMAFILAGIGFSLLTHLSSAEIDQGFSPHFRGNVLILISLCGEAAYSILGKKLTGRHGPLAIFGTSLVIGVGCLAVAISYLTDFTSIFSFSHWSWKSTLALIWLGPIGTTIAYLFTMFALAEVTVISASLLLFLQPLAGALWGSLFLGDRLHFLQYIGSGLIFLAMLIPHTPRLIKWKTH